MTMIEYTYAGYAWEIEYEPPEDYFEGRSGEGWYLLRGTLVDTEEALAHFWESDDTPLPTPEAAWTRVRRDVIAAIKRDAYDARLP